MKIEKATSALLVIDAIEAEGADPVYESDKASFDYRRNVARCVDVCHAADIPVIFCNDAHIRGIDRELDLWGEHGVAGETRIFPEIATGEGDLVIEKRRYSAFFQTDLDLTLRELGVSCVIAVGADTNICVLHTLADAYFNNYDSFVVEDATMTFLCGTQEAAIEHCEKCYGSKICSVAELESALA